MEKEIKNLIEVYAKHSVSEINNPESGGPLLADGLKLTPLEIIKAPWYRNNKEIIEVIKIEIEEIQKNSLGPKDEVQKCLSLIRTRAFNNILETSKYTYRMEIYLELVKACFKDSWTTSQMNYFSVLGEKFCTYNSYFLSYTNHNAPTINERYKSVYKSVLPQEHVTPADLEGKNLLARTLIHHLRLRNLKRGFFDLDSIHKGEKIDPVLDQNLARTFAFVQLVSLASFENSDPNYSFYEFQKYYQTNCTATGSPEFNETHKKMLYFLVLEDTFPREDLMPPEYINWLKMAKGVNHWKVYEYETSDAFAKNVAGKLIGEIMDRTTEMINAAPEN